MKVKRLQAIVFDEVYSLAPHSSDYAAVATMAIPELITKIKRVVMYHKVCVGINNLLYSK